MEVKDDYTKQEAKYFLAAIVESSQDSIVTIDLNRVITTWNKAAERLYGYPATEVIGKPLDVVLLPNDINGLIENIYRIATEVTVPIYESVRLHKNGKQADLEIALSPVRNAMGAVIGISTIARDITESKLQEELKDEFIAVASHELKTPVTSIKGYTQLLVERFQQVEDTTSRLLITKLDAQVDRMTELVKTLLDTTKLSGGHVLLKLEEFDVCSLIEEQIEQFHFTSIRHHIIYETNDACIVFADKKLIGQAVSNLLSNAIKYSPKGGEVIVSSTQTRDGVTVRIQDFGLGIPEGLSHKIFERYFRVHTSQPSTTPSIGLGLYITSKIIHQHGGAIFVDSADGAGSTFSFTLPTHKLAI